jgi:hypothetical protein
MRWRRKRKTGMEISNPVAFFYFAFLALASAAMVATDGMRGDVFVMLGLGFLCLKASIHLQNG